MGGGGGTAARLPLPCQRLLSQDLSSTLLGVWEKEKTFNFNHSNELRKLRISQELAPFLQSQLVLYNWYLWYRASSFVSFLFTHPPLFSGKNCDESPDTGTDLGFHKGNAFAVVLGNGIKSKLSRLSSRIGKTPKLSLELGCDVIPSVTRKVWHLDIFHSCFHRRPHKMEIRFARFIHHYTQNLISSYISPSSFLFPWARTCLSHP